MAVETVQKLKEALTLLSESSQVEVLTRQSLRSQVERVSIRLLKEYQATADNRYFTVFYSLSKQVLLSHARKQCLKFSFPVDPQDLVDKLYMLLYEKLLAPDGRIPLNRLFPWCFKTLLNLAREEFRVHIRLKPLTPGALQTAATPPLLDTLIKNEKEITDVKKMDQVYQILMSGQAGLSGRDRDIMLMYYWKRWPINKISEKTGLSKSHLWVILSRSKNRISKHITDRG